MQKNPESYFQKKTRWFVVFFQLKKRYEGGGGMVINFGQDFFFG
jgi:hypothetical protein